MVHSRTCRLELNILLMGVAIKWVTGETRKESRGAWYGQGYAEPKLAIEIIVDRDTKPQDRLETTFVLHSILEGYTLY